MDQEQEIFIPDWISRLHKAAHLATEAAFAASMAIHAVRDGGFFSRDNRDNDIYPIDKAREVATRRAVEAVATAEKAVKAYEEYALIANMNENNPYPSPTSNAVARAVAETVAAAGIARACVATLEWPIRGPAPWARRALAFQADDVAERALETANAALKAVCDVLRSTSPK
jgi:hypothetical protein